MADAVRAYGQVDGRAGRGARRRGALLDDDPAVAVGCGGARASRSARGRGRAPPGPCAGHPCAEGDRSVAAAGSASRRSVRGDDARQPLRMP